MVEEPDKVKDAIGRKEGQRNEQTEKVFGRKAKRRKFEKLLDWGESDHIEMLAEEQYGVEDLIGKVGASLTSMQEMVSMRNAIPVKDRIILE